ncbi:hypothetical protein Patl1_37528 [Pistacia atlantica]|nr:hypothetical protein Patl1_37528 [Pistacia atlantica]
MAENKPEARKIPVFTVIKNGAILKNIFVINKPPPPPPSPSITTVENEENSVQDDEEEEEEILMVGRHPDCHIMLTHPSISRFHPQNHSKPSSQNLSVIDLSSVHGTWVSERKIESCVPVELNEGDTIKICGSTRIYRLHWIPLSHPYDMDKPFVSPRKKSKIKWKRISFHSVLVEKSEPFETGKSELTEKSSVVEENEEGICQDEISILVHDKPSQSLDWFLEGIVSLFCDEGSELLPETEIPFSGIVPIDLACPAGALNSGCSNEEGFPEAELSEVGNHSPRVGIEQKEIPSFCSSVLEESVNSSLPVGEVLTEITDNKNSQTPQSLFYTKGAEDQENSEVSPLRSDRKLSSRSIWSRRELQIQEDIENKSISKILFTGFEEEEEEIFTPNKENFSPDTLPLKSLKRKGNLEKIKPSRSYKKSSSKITISPNIQPKEDLNFSSDKENQTPKVLQEQKLAEHASRNQVNLEEERTIMKKRAESVPFQSLVANSLG